MKFKLDKIVMPNDLKYLHSINAILSLYTDQLCRKYGFDLNKQIQYELSVISYELFAFAVDSNKGEELLIYFDFYKNKLIIKVELDLAQDSKNKFEIINHWRVDAPKFNLHSDNKLNLIVLAALTENIEHFNVANKKQVIQITKTITGITR